MKVLTFNAPKRGIKPCWNGKYHVANALEVWVPDVPVDRAFIRSDNVALVVRKWDYSTDRYTVRIVKENDIEERELSDKALIEKLIAENWKIKPLKK